MLRTLSEISGTWVQHAEIFINNFLITIQITVYKQHIKIYKQ